VQSLLGGRPAALRVLIVEDSRFDAELLTEALEAVRPDTECTLVKDEPAFVQVLSQQRFDVILSDFELPGFSGEKALRIARELAPDVPFIFVSGVIGEDNAVELLKRGATDYVSKSRLARLPVVLDRALKEAAGRHALGQTEHSLRVAHAAAQRVELQRVLLIELSDSIRELDDIGEIAYTGAATLARHLNVTRAGYGLVDAKAETIQVERDWHAPGLTSLAGSYQFRDYGNFIDELKQGRSVAIADASTDVRTQGNLAALQRLDIVALLNIPLMEEGTLIGLMYINHSGVRDWTAEELDFVQDVAARLRSVIARREAQIALQNFASSLERQVEERAAELEAAKEQLRQSQKLEAVGQLTGGIAHDFNNLLGAISGALELMRRQGEHTLSPNLKRYIGIAQGATQRAASLTHRLLAFSRRQTLEAKLLRLNGVIAGMEELVRRTVGPTISLEVAADPALWNVFVDEGQFENALLNLCINARDAMPDGGTLTIRTSNRTLDARSAGTDGLQPGEYVAVSVTDTGVGMPPEVAALAFDPFYTTKPLGQGTGLGLSMIYGFAKQSGGRVSIQSKVGVGTTVCMELPRSDLAPADTEDTMVPAAAPRADHGETVLVVDDEPALRMLIVEVMQELGYTTLEAGDGVEALHWLRSGRRIDLLVTDVGMPGGMNGRQVADAGRGLRPGLRVLFITGYAEGSMLDQQSFDTDMQVLTKPFEMDTLARRVKALIERS